MSPPPPPPQDPCPPQPQPQPSPLPPSIPEPPGKVIMGPKPRNPAEAHRWLFAIAPEGVSHDTPVLTVFLSASENGSWLVRQFWFRGKIIPSPDGAKSGRARQ